MDFCRSRANTMGDSGVGVENTTVWRDPNWEAMHINAG